MERKTNNGINSHIHQFHRALTLKPAPCYSNHFDKKKPINAFVYLLNNTSFKVKHVFEMEGLLRLNFKLTFIRLLCKV